MTNELVTFIENSYEHQKNAQDFPELCIILGNESCDLDSMVSAIALGFYKWKKSTKNGENVAIFPVINSEKQDFLAKKDNCHLLECAGIDLEKIIYRNSLDFPNLLKNHPKILVSLVDHHELSANDKIFENFLSEIYDHRPLSKKITVENCITEVGSCATLIAQLFLQEEEKGDDFLPENLAYLLYCTIIFDTLALKPERMKCTPLDTKMAEYLCKKLKNFNKNPDEIFEKILEKHTDVSHLTPEQILKSDLKIILGKIPAAGLPFLTETFLKKHENLRETFRSFCENFKSEVLILVGIEKINGEIHRDLGVFCDKMGGVGDLCEGVVKIFRDHRDEWGLSERQDWNGEISVFEQKNLKISRKQVVPLIEEYLKNL